MMWTWLAVMSPPPSTDAPPPVAPLASLTVIPAVNPPIMSPAASTDAAPQKYLFLISSLLPEFLWITYVCSVRLNETDYL